VNGRPQGSGHAPKQLGQAPDSSVPAREARCVVPLPSPAAASTVLPPPTPSSLQEELNLQPLIPVALPPSLIAQGWPPSLPAAPMPCVPMPSASSLRGLSGDSLQRLLEALHAEALTRGMIMTPLLQQAHRGVSALSLSTMPPVCSECQQSGEWRDGSPSALICCELCITVTHCTCSGASLAQLQEDGWLCDDCWMINPVKDP
jgi:hypothetical protein